MVTFFMKSPVDRQNDCMSNDRGVFRGDGKGGTCPQNFGGEKREKDERKKKEEKRKKEKIEEKSKNVKSLAKYKHF